MASSTIFKCLSFMKLCFHAYIYCLLHIELCGFRSTIGGKRDPSNLILSTILVTKIRLFFGSRFQRPRNSCACLTPACSKSFFLSARRSWRSVFVRALFGVSLMKLFGAWFRRWNNHCCAFSTRAFSASESMTNSASDGDGACTRTKRLICENELFAGARLAYCSTIFGPVFESSEGKWSSPWISFTKIQYCILAPSAFEKFVYVLSRMALTIHV